MAKLQIISDEQLDHLSETSSGHPIARSVYQRKVRVTLTRAQAGMLERMLLRVAADTDLARGIGVGYASPGEVRSRAKESWRKVNRAIEKRDREQRIKEYGSPVASNSENVSDQDTPLF